MTPAVERDGYATVTGFRLYYRIFDPPTAKGTVLCLHGGPGMMHDYLLPLADLTDHGYRVVFFDQLACGKSERPPGNELFTVDHHVEEVEGMRQALDLGRVHLMGSSYGGLLAIAYALRYPSGLRSLITTGGLANVPLTTREMQRLKSELPEPIRRTLAVHEARGEYEHPDYVAATMEFYRRHVCRLPEWPPELVRTLEEFSRPVYFTMNGPNEFTITGRIKDIDYTSELSKIRVPTLVTTGPYDEVTPRVAESIHQGIAGSELVRFDGCSHTPMWEDRGRYIATLADFLDRVG